MRRKKMLEQRLIGLCMILIGILEAVLEPAGPLPLGGDCTAAMITIALGLALLLSKSVWIV